jgi:hypothetical protein
MDWQSALLTLVATLLLGAMVGLVIGFKAKSIARLDDVRDFLQHEAPELAQADLLLAENRRSALGIMGHDGLFLIVMMGDHMTLVKNVYTKPAQPTAGSMVYLYTPTGQRIIPLSAAMQQALICSSMTSQSVI